jgi:cysteinyl-tRNA synthetase
MGDAVLRVHNSLTRNLEPLEPAEPGHVRMYVCGMTVYDYCHIGHARAMLTFDVVYRHLLYRDYKVTYVRNHTDVDDKIIARAAELGEHPLALSERFIQALDEDLAALGLLVPTVQPKVSDNIDGIVALNQKLVDRGHAYAVDGDLYFDVTSFDEYGKLSGRKLEDLRAGERVAVDTRKRHPGDFALWKSAKEGEISWDSPWGAGRPGWHIECSVMSMKHLGDTFDIHGGGIDLIFPHHENELAQSECGTGHAPFSKVWLHNGHLTLVESQDDGGECEIKMSKSLGNVIRIRDIVQEIPHEALRLLYLGTHYRSPLPFSTDRLSEATCSLDRIYQAKETATLIAAKPPKGNQAPDKLAKELNASALWELACSFEKQFGEAMDQDFNTAKAVGLIFELTRLVNRLGNDKSARKRGGPLFAEALKAFDVAAQVLGIGGMAPEDFFEELKQKRIKAIGLDEAWVDGKLQARLQARTDKDWAAADAIRAELDDKGVEVMDSAGGVTWRVRL